MQQILDLHIHSKYSRACSPLLNLENIDQFCKIKGVDIIATGDFTYPRWFKEIENKLEEIGQTGLFKLKNSVEKYTKFILGTEVSLIYKKNDRVRKVHILIFAPSIKAVKILNEYLDKHYNIRSDGRPILGMSAEQLCELCLGIDDNFMIIPAHIWTPWFSVFGSKSGFDSLEECFGKWTKRIKAIETGLSSDPEMNWSISALDNITLLSNSDAHSLPNIGREANIFDLEEITYTEIKKVIEGEKRKSFIKTIEFYPEEGIYHFDGHRDCAVVFNPEESKIYNNVCPKCHKELTIGVLNRVLSLADRKFGYKPKNAVPFQKIVELDKIIAESLNIKSRSSKKVQDEYNKILSNGDSELEILIKLSEPELNKITNAKIVSGVLKARKGDVKIASGFDGQYGKVSIF